MGSGECFLLQVQVGVQVDLGGVDAFVAEPKRDNAGVDTGVQEPHGGGVSQHVDGDGLALQRRAFGGRLGGVVGEAVFDRVAAEQRAAAGRKQRIGVLTGLVVEPAAKHGDGAGSERGDPVFASFAVAGDVGADAEVDVGAGERGEFGDPQPGLHGEQQQGMVAAPGPGG